MCVHRNNFNSFGVGWKLYDKSFRSEKQWIPVIVEARTGPVSYRLRTNDGKIIHRHLDHLSC